MAFTHYALAAILTTLVMVALQVLVIGSSWYQIFIAQ